MRVLAFCLFVTAGYGGIVHGLLWQATYVCPRVVEALVRFRVDLLVLRASYALLWFVSGSGGYLMLLKAAAKFAMYSPPGYLEDCTRVYLDVSGPLAYWVSYSQEEGDWLRGERPVLCQECLPVAWQWVWKDIIAPTFMAMLQLNIQAFSVALEWFVKPAAAAS
ncbi:unnamed protein product, partial [Discosporangium mesarthrocarpum]